jgi:hypothetical protein
LRLSSRKCYSNQGGSIGLIRLAIALLFGGTVAQTTAPINIQATQEPTVQQVQEVQQKEKPQERPAKPKKVEQAKPAPVPEPVETVPEPVPAAPVITGNKETWLLASGIPKDQWSYVDAIVSRESGWNPCAYNPGLSDCNANPTSACGLAQSLPCGKQSSFGHWTDPVANLKWQYQYVTARYGGYAQAVEFWNANHWY